MKYLYIIILLLTASLFAAQDNKGDFVKILYSNRDYIISTYDNCKRISSVSGREIPCGGSFTKPVFDTLFTGKSLDFWYLKKEEVLKYFLRFYNDSYSSFNTNYRYTNDDSLVKILIRCLSDTTNHSTKVIEWCAGSLVGYTARPQLIKHSKLIREMRNTVNEKIGGYRELLVLSNTDKKEADSLLKADSSMPLHYRARLGDIVAEDTLLAMYDAEKNNYFRKSKILKWLTFVGSEKCIKKLIFKLNEPLYDYCKDKVHLTIRYKILKELYPLFPDVPSFRDEFYKFQQLATGNLYNTELIKNFINQLLLWAEKKYGVKPEHENEYLLQGAVDCIEYH